MMKLCILLIAFVAFAAAFKGSSVRKLFRPSSLLKLSDVTTPSETAQVFIGNLPFTIDENELTSLVQDRFSTAINALKIIKDRNTGNSRGFGYVTYSSKAEAEAAVAALTGIEVDGRGLKVDIVIPRTDSNERRERPTNDFRADRPRRESADFKAFIGNLDFKTKEADVLALCEQKIPGVVTRADLVYDRETGRLKGFGYLVVNSAEDIPKVISALSGSTLLNRDIRVDQATPRDKTVPRREFSSPPPRTPAGGNSLYLGNLAWDVTQEIIEGMILDLVGPDTFLSVRVATDRESGKPKGFCHVDFKDAETLEKALSVLDGVEVYGRALKVDKAQARPKTTYGDSGGFRRGGRSNDRYSEGGQSSFNAW